MPSTYADGTETADAEASASPSASPTLADPLTACTTQLTYWAGEILRGAPDQGGDYQHMGLTSTSYEELLALVAQRTTAAERVAGVAGRAGSRRLPARRRRPCHRHQRLAVSPPPRVMLSH